MTLAIIYWETRRRQCNQPTLGVLFTELYALGDWLVKEHFSDVPEMTVPIITLEVDRPNRKGHYTPNDSTYTGARINLNPRGRGHQTGTDLAETLAHELVHHWQTLIGRPTVNDYHTNEFHYAMWNLFGIKTDEVSGKHFGFDIRWETLKVEMDRCFGLDRFKLPGAEKSQRRLIRHECPSCQASFHARRRLNVSCLDCSTSYVID